MRDSRKPNKRGSCSYGEETQETENQDEENGDEETRAQDEAPSPPESEEIAYTDCVQDHGSAAAMTALPLAKAKAAAEAPRPRRFWLSLANGFRLLTKAEQQR